MSNRHRILIAETAEAEMYAAYNWIAKEAPVSAVDWLTGLLDAITSLEQFPERCQLAPESNLFEEEIRVLLYGKSSVYRILFTVEGNRVMVLYIRHGSRGWLTADDMPKRT